MKIFIDERHPDGWHDGTESAETSAEQKLAAALEYLGDKWLLHPTHHVKRLDVPQEEWKP